MIRSFLILILLSCSIMTFSQIELPESSSYCEPIWQEASIGFCMRQSIVYDFDKDGIEEFIYASQHHDHGGDFARGASWTIRKYNPSNQKYEVLYQSYFIEDWNIQSMIIADLDENGSDELLIGGNENLHIFSLTDFKLQACIDIRKIGYGSLKRMFHVDLNNDGSNELILSSFYSLLVLNGNSLEEELYFPDLKSGACDIGNIDTDPANELVLPTGEVLEFSPDGSYLVEHQLNETENWNNGTIIELTNINEDSKLEVITWLRCTLKAYDLEFNGPLYEITRDSDLMDDRFILKDINSDGKNELIYSTDEFFGNNIIVRDTKTGEAIYSYDGSSTDPTGLIVSDFDGDGQLEYLVGYECGASAEDYILVVDLASNRVEYDLRDVDHFVFKRTFYGQISNLELRDLGQDGTIEVLCVSAEGILNIYKANTQELLFRDKVFESFNDVRNLELHDFDEDGIDDFYIFSNSIVNVVNGSTFEKEVYQDFFPSLVNQKVVDLNGDGNYRILGSNKGGVFLLDDKTFEILWQSQDLTPPGFPTRRDYSNALFDINLDADPAKEIICVNYKVYRFDNEQLDMLSTSNDHYTCATGYEASGNSKKHIITGTNDGALIILDGENLSTIDSFKLTDQAINNLIQIDQDNDGIKEIFAVTNNVLFRWSGKDKPVDSLYLYGTAAGRYDAFKFADIDNDQILELFIGSGFRFQQVDLSCFDCNKFETEVIATNLNCSDTLWSLNISANQTLNHIYFNSFEVDDKIEPLKSGQHSVVLENEEGCQDIYHIELKNEPITASWILPLDISCGTFGSALPIITGGNEPFSFEWSNGDTTELLKTEETGTYYVTMTDATNCTVEDSVDVGEIEGGINIFKLSETCRSNSFVQVILAGNHSIAGEYYWNGIQGPNPIENLPPGNYTVEAIDVNGCVFSESFELQKPMLELSAETENTCEGDSSGYIKINASQGLTPYTYTWSSSVLEGRELNNLSAGNYRVTVTDRNECSGTISITIEDNKLDTFYMDLDGDGFGTNDFPSIISCTAPDNYVSNNTDCDDNNFSINPDREERPYNGKDDDCDPLTRDDDLDQDGFNLIEDCDDNDPLVHPDAEEICDKKDNNCNELIDEGLTLFTFYPDADNDGFGDMNSPIEDCIQPVGTVSNQEDCNDLDSNINPDAEDIPNNGIDEDCDGMDATSNVLNLSNAVVKIYPNPVIDKLFIIVKGGLNFQATIYDTASKKILEVNNPQIINTTKLLKGTYLLELKDLQTKRSIIHKLIK